MINNLLTFLLWSSLSGSILIGVLLLLKPLLSSRIPPRIWYVLWILVVIRLLFPFGMGERLLNRMTQGQETTKISLSSGSGFAQNQNWGNKPEEAPTAYPEAAAGHTSETVLPEGNETQKLPTTMASDPVFITEGLVWLKAYLPASLVILWALGAVFAFLWFFLPYRSLIHSLRTDKIPADEEDLQILRQLSPCGSIPMAYQTALKSPCLISLRHPLILLPDTHYVWEGETQELKNILRHELIHVKRRDLFFKWLAVIVSSLHWFNPLMPLMRRRLAFYCELSCDEAATRTLSLQDKQSYGATLLHFACASPSISPLTTAMCQEKKELKERLESIMNDTHNTKAHVICSLALFLVIIALAVVIGPGSHVLADESSQENTSAADAVGNDSTGSDTTASSADSYESAATANTAPAVDTTAADTLPADTAENPGSAANSSISSAEGWVAAGEENIYYVEVQGKTVKLIFNSVNNAPADDSPYWEMRRADGLSEADIAEIKANWAHKSGADIDLLSAYGTTSTNPDQHSYLYLIAQTLEKLYEISGKTFDELYFSLNKDMGLRLFFSVTGDNNKESFLNVEWGLASEVYEEDYPSVGIGHQSITYQEISMSPIFDGSPFSPLSLQDMKAPENRSDLSWEALAKWYLANYCVLCDPGNPEEMTAELNTYDNIGDDQVSIWVYNAKGYAFDLSMDRETGALVDIYGPYPNGDIQH